MSNLFKIYIFLRKGDNVSASEITKQAIVSSTKELVCEKDFEKISVIEIATRCSINRNTFYYYFKDKYEVIEFIFESEIKPVLAPFEENKDLALSVSALCRHLKREKTFYAHILRCIGHCSLRQMLVRYYNQYLLDAARENCKRLEIPEESRNIIAKFYAHGTVGMICEWAETGMKKDADVATRIIQLSAKEQFFV